MDFHGASSRPHFRASTNGVKAHAFYGRGLYFGSAVAEGLSNDSIGAAPLKRLTAINAGITGCHVTSVGIVGGLGPESTVDYYLRILRLWQLDDPATAPSIVIDSLDVERALHLVDTDRSAFAEYLFASIERLARAGVDFVAMTANTPHIVFDELAARAPVPLISIVEVCADAARQRGLAKVALLGTRFTMEATFYPTVLGRRGIQVVTPSADDRAWVHARYVGELLKGDFRDETREQFASLIAKLRDEMHIDGVILGGTELPLLLTTPTIADLPLLDTTALHVAAIVKRLRPLSEWASKPSS